MIGYITGKLAATWGNACVVLTQGGTGYRIFLPGHTFAQLPAQGSDVAFYTCMTVRENAIELFGFATSEERQTFDLLRGISKIGARTALAILTACRPSDLAQLVAEDNVGALTRIPGIGKKTAQHILLELKNRLPRAGSGASQLPAASGLYSDVLAALLNLGYGEEECAKTVQAIVDAEPDLDPGSAIRQALKKLARS